MLVINRKEYKSRLKIHVSIHYHEITKSQKPFGFVMLKKAAMHQTKGWIRPGLGKLSSSGPRAGTHSPRPNTERGAASSGLASTSTCSCPESSANPIPADFSGHPGAAPRAAGTALAAAPWQCALVRPRARSCRGHGTPGPAQVTSWEDFLRQCRGDSFSV